MHIIAAGLSVVTDLGRFGASHLGLQTNGAADRFSARAANILVGNPDDAPIIEILTLRPFSLTIDRRALIAVTGASDLVTIDGNRMTLGSPILTWPGANITVSPATSGSRAYLAIHGRIPGDDYLGSVAPDTLIGRGLTLTDGDDVSVGDAGVSEPPFFAFFKITAPTRRFTNTARLDVLDGPEAAEFPDLDQLPALHLTVGTDSDHAGARLEGHRFARDGSGEILSRGVPVGAIEVPPSGTPIILLRGRPITAGYPVPLVVARACHTLLGQMRPGDTVTLRHATIPEAHAKAAQQERLLTTLRQQCATAFRACDLFDPDFSSTPISR